MSRMTPASGARGLRGVLPVLVALLGSLAAPPATAVAATSTLYVSATAPAHGNGSRHAPFGSLRAVERASAPGDRIVVLRSPATVPPLDGGIALKPGQRLIGAGPSALQSVDLAGAPRIANTSGRRLSGDAVVLARDAVVRNLVVGPSYRGGIYGRNTTGVTIRGNDVLDHNGSCTRGFHIQPFVVPTTAPGVGAPISGGLTNGWAGIMVDARRASGDIRIAHNRVHDAECGDGIDLRLSGSADIRAEISRNLVSDLEQGENVLSVLAIGMQTLDRSKLVARLRRNREIRIGSVEAGPGGGRPGPGSGLPLVGADSEGVFANLDDTSSLTAEVGRNTFRQGIGGFSANGMEMVITGGSPVARMRISDSTFTDVPGDVLEAINFGTGARMSLWLDNVVAARSNGFGNSYVIPGNNGDCLVVGQTGAGDVTTLHMSHTKLADCVNNGLTIGSNVVNEERGAARRLSFRIEHSQITGNRGYNLRVANLTGLEKLVGRVEDTNLADSGGVASVAFDDLGHTDRAVLDLGGGPLGSAGDNCIFGGGALDAEAIGYRVVAENNWWGRPGGPAIGRTLAVGRSLDHAPALAAPPAGVC